MLANLKKEILPYIHKSLHNVPGRRPVLSNYVSYTENISSFLDHHLQPIAEKVNSFIKELNHFLCKIKSLGQFPEGAFLRTTDVRRFLDARMAKEVTAETLVKIAEIVAKSNIFQFNEITLKQSRGTTIGTKFAPPYSILFMADLEKIIFEGIET